MTAVTFGLGGLVYFYLRASDVPPDDQWIIHGEQLTSLVLTGALFLVARSPRFPDGLVLRLGLAYLIVACLNISTAIPAFLWSRSETIPYMTFATLLIAVYPLIVPSPPALTLGTSIAAAATVPLGLLLLLAREMIPIEAVDLVGVSIAPVAGVAIAVFGSRVVHGMNREVARARELGSYRLEKLLGRGGMGEVWTARHRLLARPAAVKLIKPDVLGTNAELAVQRFEREAQATALLRSPHTIEVYDYGVADDGTLYYVMELLEGFDTDSLVRKFGPLSPGRTAHVLRQVCDSLAEAHETGLIHRDVKPANVFVCRYGRTVDFVKVLDFGLVKGGGEPRESLELTAEQVGTPAFMAPEQIQGEGPLDGRTDVYGLGCLAYWLLTGELVFTGKTALNIMMDHVHTEPIPPSRKIGREVPAGLESLVLDCLAKSRDDRPATLDEVARRIEAIPDLDEWGDARARCWWEEHGTGVD